jgi:hypothetical protein
VGRIGHVLGHDTAHYVGRVEGPHIIDDAADLVRLPPQEAFGQIPHVEPRRNRQAEQQQQDE